MSWSRVTLGELIEIKHGFAFKGAFFSDAGQYILLTPGNCHESGGLKLKGSKEKYYTGDIPEDYLLSTGDLLVVMTDLVNTAPILGGAFIIPEDDRFLHNQRLGLLNIRDDTRIHKKFLYYLLNTNTYRGQVRGSASGATVRHTSPGRIERCEVRIPDSTKEQARIASILSAYDDLIENNRRRIQLLEQAARLLYKEWFVHLRFPGHEHVTITDGVPEGWEKATVANVCTSFDDGDWIESKDQGGEDFRLLQISNIGDNGFVETGNFRYITSETFRNLRCNEVVPGDILISRMPKPIGRAWYVYEQPWRMITAVDVTIARPNSDIVDPFYYLYHLNSTAHIARCELRATGATRPRVSRKNMGALPILKPPMSLQRNFGETASAINAQRKTLTRQNGKLTEARDLLLPRLMNGEVDVSEVEIATEAAV